MSATTQTKIFGIRLGVDPKILVVALIGAAAVLFWYNSRDAQDNSGPSAVTRPESANSIPAVIKKSQTLADRRRSMREERGTLRLKAVDPTRGDIDPTLRLDFLARLHHVQAPSSIRNLFETGPAVSATGGAPAALPNRVIPVKLPIAPPIQPAYTLPSQMSVNVPFKYYGFAKPVNPGDGSRGFFMEGDNILVAVEGQLLQSRYLVVQLTPHLAKVEDTQVKLSQTLPVVPEALEQSGGMARPAQPEMNPGMMNQGADDNQ